MPDDGHTDVIVVGAGGCGLVAALAAARQGLRVLVLEKAEEPGGTTALSGGSIVAAGSRFQRAAGVEDVPSALLEEVLQRSDYLQPRTPAEEISNGSAEVVEWLADITGLEFDVPVPLTTHSVRRLHTWGTGRELVDHLMAAAEVQENIRILCSTPVRSLTLDASGAVTGVETDAGRIAGRKVILATGGFAASRDLLSRYIPKAVGLAYTGHHGSTGDGLAMGLDAGAAQDNIGAFQPYPCYYAALRHPLPGNMVFLGAIHVDRKGRRLADETLFPGVLGARMLDLPSKQAYQIFDQRIYDGGGDRLQVAVDAGVVERRETAAELASRLDIDSQGLEKTIEEYNATAASGGVDRFRRTLSEPLRSPLYGVRVDVAIYHTQGGLKVDGNAHVLRPDGSPLANLYAGGGAAAGISGPKTEGYLPGNGLLQSLGLGKIAGDHAAASLRGSK